MNGKSSLAERRQLLRMRMQVQRELIAHHLGPAAGADCEYPRSMTMRFLLGRPGAAVKLVAGLATLLIGSRFFRA
ncbi:MAG: hypothetical protein AB7T20_08560 [Steroidobacteraceae bacterium]